MSLWETEAGGSQVWSQGGVDGEFKVEISKVARLHLKINKSRASNEATFYTGPRCLDGRYMLISLVP